ncbi:MAG TPA: OmpA family protein [Bryobacteraceae bacterium]|nr:OmpA family protein [Bryobacteraceae bacterium]
MKTTYTTLACFVFPALLSAQVMVPSRINRPPKAMAAGTELKALDVGEDEPGCKDSTLLPRVAGCSILQCGSKADEPVELAIGLESDGEVRKAQADGDSEMVYYLCPTKVTHQTIVKHTQDVLAKSGYLVLFNGSDEDGPLVAARKGVHWVQVNTYTYDGKAAYVQTLFKPSPEETITADAFEEQLGKNDRVVLTGLQFQEGKLDLTPEGEKVLSEVARVLAKQQKLRLLVEAHAGDGPDKTTNASLSEQRAASVLSWLSAHGVAQDRLAAAGRGDSMPSPESTQRIEVIKQ